MKHNFPIRHEFVEFIPEPLSAGVVYVSIPYATAAHNCFCGCGSKIVTPLSRRGWSVTFDGESVSLHPSIEMLTGTISSNFGFGADRKKVLRETLAAAAETIKDQYFEAASSKLKNEFFWTIEDMVRLMPKQEIANLAEALVNITIIKRKVSVVR